MKRKVPANEKEAAIQAYRRAYYLANKERANAQAKAYRESHKEELKLYFRKHNIANRVAKGAYAKAYRAAHPRVPRDHSKCNAEYNAKNREVLKQKRKEKYWANRDVHLAKMRKQREEHAEYWRQYYVENKEAMRKASARWIENNPERIRASRSRRRARLRDGRSPGVTVSEWGQILEAHQHLCAYCRNPNGAKKLERDHVIPISKGGLDAPENVVPACRSCNARKHAKLDWRPLDRT
jgi:5-methylcytosine-specific restriction endonuclease McrA